MQDADFERELISKFDGLRGQAIESSIVPEVVQEIKRHQRLQSIRPLLVLLATGLGLVLSAPALIGLVDLNSILLVIGENTQAASALVADVTDATVRGLPQLASPLLIGLLSMGILGSVAIAAET